MSDSDFLFHGVAFNPATVEVREFTFEDLDRELIEVLNELRVTLPGVHVLFTFLLIAPFA